MQQLKKERFRYNSEVQSRKWKTTTKTEEDRRTWNDHFGTSHKYKSPNQMVKEWSKEANIHGLKLRFVLSVDGYLLSTNYPAPMYSMLA